MLDAEAANANARFALVQAWERFDKDLEDTLENDRRIAEARRCQELTDALLAAMKSADALERFKASKEKTAHAASAKAKPKSYSEQFRTRSANRAEIYAARDGAIREFSSGPRQQDVTRAIQGDQAESKKSGSTPRVDQQARR